MSTNPNPKWLEQEHRHQGKFTSTVRSTLWMSYRPFLTNLILFLTCGLLGRAFILGNANIIGFWVDSISQNSHGHRPAPAVFAHFTSADYVMLLSLMTASGFILTWIFRVGFSGLSAKAVSQLYDEVTFRTSRAPMAFFDANPVGRIVTRFSSDYGNVFRLFGGPLAEFISIIFDLICMVVLISVASPYYFPIVLLISFFNFLVWKFHQGKLRSARRQLSASRSPSIAHFAETAQGSSNIRIFNREPIFEKRFHKLDDFFQTCKLKTVVNVLRFSFHMNLMTSVMLLLIGLTSYWLIQGGLVTVGSMGVAFAFVALSGNTIQMFFEWLAQFEEAMIGVERLDSYLRREIEPAARLPFERKFLTSHWAETALDVTEGKHRRKMIHAQSAVDLEFKNVSFGYSEDGPEILHNINFSVNKGEHIGIVGRTASGKSSLIQALLQLYPIRSGTITLDGKRVQQAPGDSGIPLEDFRSQMAFISQDPVVFRGPLRFNLDIKGTLTDQEMLDALQRVGISEFANQASLDLMIEEKGKNLSLGQKQLLCMARCLLQKAPLIIMDEATSSVDPRSEEIMVRATQEFFQERTQLIIAHRLSTLKKCHRVIWIHDGKVRKIGKPDEVLSEFQNANLSLSLNGLTDTRV